MAAERIEQLAVRGGIEQAAVIGLTMYLDQFGAKIAEQADADGFVVDESARAAVGGDCPPQDDFAITRNAVVGDQHSGCMFLIQIENSDGRALARTAAHAGATASAAAGGQTQGIEKNGFSRAGFAGKDVQPRCEVQRNVLDENEVADFQRRQHAEADLEGAR